MKKEYLKSTLIIVVVVLIFGGAMFALNILTGPIIEENNKGAEFGPLYEVMSDADSFTLAYDASNPEDSTLKNIKESVSKIYKETTDKGYVIKGKTKSQYSSADLEFTIGITSEGKICGVKIDSYNESLDFKDYPSTFIGQDSTLADVGVTAGVTYSSKAFKGAVEDAFSALIDNNLIKEAVKTDDQILTELIASKHTGLAQYGTLKCEEVVASGNVVKGYKGTNGSGFALIIKEGEAMFLAVTNNLGGCKVYDVKGNDVTTEHTTVVNEAKEYVAKTEVTYKDKLIKKVNTLMENAEGITEVNVDIFNTVVASVKFTANEKTYYAFYSRSFGFQMMNVYFIIDENGAIAKMSADEFIFEKEYFFQFDQSWDEGAYMNGFVGVTKDTFKDQAIIATATMSSNAIKQSTNDSFAIFNSLQGGNTNE